MASHEEIIDQLSELVAQLRADEAMSSKAGPFQAPPPPGAKRKIKSKQKPKPHVDYVVRLRLSHIRNKL